MYERFTDRARKVMVLANQEAQRLNHECITNEHVLLGLVKEGSGVAANVIRRLEVDISKIRLEVEKIVPSGPDTVTNGKLPLSPRAKQLLEYVREEARNLNHNYVGTEHLLLGLLREQEGVAAQVLMNLGLRLDGVREEVLNILGRRIKEGEKSERVPSGGRYEVRRNELYERFTDRAREVMRFADQEAQRWNHDYIDTEHLLLGLLRVPEGVGAQVLMHLGLKLEAVRKEVLDLLGLGE